MHSLVLGSNVSPIRGGSVSPVSNRSTTPTANDFPVPAGQDFTVRKRDRGLVSPSQSSFLSFADDDEPPIHAITAPHRIQSRAPSRKASVDLGRKLSIDGAAGYMCNDMLRHSPEQEIRKKRSQFYTEVFSYRELNITPKDRIYKDSVVTVEVKTNVIVRSLPSHHPDQYPLSLKPYTHGTSNTPSPHRSATNTNSSKTSPSTSPNATNVQQPVYSSI